LKDVKLRTFITDDQHRDEMVAHVYDTTYEVLKKGKDTLVVIDDSIVRGTTLEKSILKMLDRLGPKKIVVVSSAPQIRFPDCYGIDMSKMGDFLAFRAMISLLKDRGKDYMLGEVYERCIRARGHQHQQNYVKHLYDQFTINLLTKKFPQKYRKLLGLPI
jgi:amidophosphoribosyltransferase